MVRRGQAVLQMLQFFSTLNPDWYVQNHTQTPEYFTGSLKFQSFLENVTPPEHSVFLPIVTYFLISEYDSKICDPNLITPTLLGHAEWALRGRGDNHSHIKHRIDTWSRLPAPFTS